MSRAAICFASSLDTSSAVAFFHNTTNSSICTSESDTTVCRTALDDGRRDVLSFTATCRLMELYGPGTGALRGRFPPWVKCMWSRSMRVSLKRPASCRLNIGSSQDRLVTHRIGA